MAAPPTTTLDFLELVRRSELIEEKRFEDYLQAHRDGALLPEQPKKLARQLIRDGLLTRFQAEQLLMGRYKPFTLAGKYRLLERIGVGGMGYVYLCEHTALCRRVAIKVLPTEHADNDDVRERFFREARAAAALDHANLARVHDIEWDGKMPFLVMEYVDGRSFHDIVGRRGPMSVERAAHYITQAALGLDHACSRGLVHRDVKPANILLDRSGTVKLLDLGLARFFTEQADELTAQSGGNKHILGTADYVAPEQAMDSHNADVRADIYGLGCTLYFLLIGKAPFHDRKSLGQKLMAHQNDQPVAVHTLRSEVPKALDAVIFKMMSKDPNQRYQTPRELIEALEPWTRKPIAPPSEGEMPQFCPAVRDSGSTISTRVPTLSSVPAVSRSGPPRTPFPVSPSAARVRTSSASQPPPLPAAPPRRTGWSLVAAVLIGVLTAGIGFLWWDTNGGTASTR
jgi:serine/threonine protein kinase